MNEHQLDVRQEEQLNQAYRRAEQIVLKSYMPELAGREIIPMDETERSAAVSDTVRLFKLDRLVYDRDEFMLDKLSGVYSALAGSGGSLVVIVSGNGTGVDFYVGARTEANTGALSAGQNTLEKAFKGSFPGSEMTRLRNPQIDALMDNVFRSPYENSRNPIAAVSGVASLRSEDKDRFVQGIEKLIDAMRGDAFTALFVADPVRHAELRDIRRGYEELYTQLSPFASSDLHYSANESGAITEGLTSGFSETLNESLARTQAMTESSSETRNSSVNYGRNILVSTVNRFIGGKTGMSQSEGATTSASRTSSEASTTGSARTNSSQESRSQSTTEGTGRSLQIKIVNKSVETLLDRIDDQLERLKKAEDLGLWNCAAYFVAGDVQTARIAANTYRALMRGDNSSVESGCVNTWDNRNGAALALASDYVAKLRHPLIRLEDPNAAQALVCTPGSLVNGHELAIHAGLPLKSISGLPVIEVAAFGRNVAAYDRIAASRAVGLGRIFHMGAIEETSVDIDLDSLTMHTFVTGSTGSGKSNTIYQLLGKLRDRGVPFLVIEPAKGEYKQVFGGLPGVRVLGTNASVTELLRLNPFAFPEGVHVLEHIDRLVEIFNACWPMYAAMPAVLKEAIEQAYVASGWDLEDSLNYGGPNRFPTFRELMDILPDTIRSSEYSDEVKGNYVGALVTRVRSMTNGINGRIFSGEETDPAVLFDGSCIVDLNRVGSSETKALLMGILVMRLQEHRSAAAGSMNGALRHVTVLEEAHNLLRRTSAEQSQEGSNLQGKAVEMLANAIAEMRTYGEGFVIADQSPGLLDLSVIRNTNTKLILRLPDEQDRLLVGRAANLNEEQIEELARLRVGVAAVYQNNWLQPVLCAMDRFEAHGEYRYAPPPITERQANRRMLGDLVRLLLAGRTGERPDAGSLARIEPIGSWLANQPFGDRAKRAAAVQLEELRTGGRMPLWDEEQFETLVDVVSSLFNGRELLRAARQTRDLRQWNEAVKVSVRQAADLSLNETVETAVVQCLLREQSGDDEEAKQFYFLWVEDANGRGIA